MTLQLVRDAPMRSLDEIAESIRAHWSATEEDRFAIGRDLIEARDQIDSDPKFGQWVELQGFPFSQQWRNLLMQAARREPEVRAVLTSQLVGSGTTNFERAVKAVYSPPMPPILGLPEAPKEAPSLAAREAIAALNAVAKLDVQAIVESMTPAQSTRIRAACRRAQTVIDGLDVRLVVMN